MMWPRRTCWVAPVVVVTIYGQTWFEIELKGHGHADRVEGEGFECSHLMNATFSVLYFVSLVELRMKTKENVEGSVHLVDLHPGGRMTESISQEGNGTRDPRGNSDVISVQRGIDELASGGVRVFVRPCPSYFTVLLDYGRAEWCVL
uniref:Uncharacterized protein n=1 Tax=Compsopogon caeruleus TaxID=31354 RepID=A0A7S1TDQ3_9RHOD|mmetsp:Transcript_2480/g.4292  ORF Transcript_2480/g.4292 Transcript_2480/m.4292 type:complete len:147 (+) Transcript_2480:307-747(+)